MSAIPRVEAKLSIDLSPLTALGGRASNLTPVWVDDVQPIVTDFLLQRFASEGAYGGAKWAPHAPVTKELRKGAGRGRGGIGRDTNRLWASLVKSAGTSAAPGGLLAITPTRYERGSALPYAAPFAGGYNSTHRPVRGKGKDGKPGWVFLRRASPKHIAGRPIFPDPVPPEFITQVATAVRRYIGGDA